MDHGPAPSTATGHYWNTLQSDAEIRMHLPIIELQSILWSSNIISRNSPFSKNKTQNLGFKDEWTNIVHPAKKGFKPIFLNLYLFPHKLAKWCLDWPPVMFTPGHGRRPGQGKVHFNVKCCPRPSPSLGSPRVGYDHKIQVATIMGFQVLFPSRTWDFPPFQIH